ncbi:hypothetical protein MFIFM68171_02541 [Madurella fahalii]|uniref:DUF7514 domain-containing protein n=1 Tax=Madurella fahalii TaxID=1157608 RepID=A0ABQ0G3J5_9PEZI
MVFRALREVGRQVRTSITESIQHHQQQQYLLQQQQLFQPSTMTPSHGHPYYFTPPQPLSSQWPLLINPNQTPTPLFAALLDAIFTLSLPSDSSNTVDMLTPTRLAAVYDELGYPQADNLPFLLFRHAQSCGNVNPHLRANEGMQMAWRLFQLDFVTANNGTPGLTRRGFRELMVRDGLIYPIGQAKAWSTVVEKHRGKLGGMMPMGMAVPTGEIPAEAFMPTGVPATGDAEVQRVYKERQGRWIGEYNARFGGQGMGVEMDGGFCGGNWEIAKQMQDFKHQMTMDAMTPGYRLPNGNVVWTGGLNW